MSGQDPLGRLVMVEDDLERAREVIERLQAVSADANEQKGRTFGRAAGGTCQIVYGYFSVLKRAAKALRNNSEHWRHSNHIQLQESVTTC